MSYRVINKLLLSFFILVSGSVSADVIINEISIGADDYIELYNYGSTPIDLANYTLNVRDSFGGSADFDFTMPSSILAPNSSVIIVGEPPVNAGEINIGQNIMWFPNRDVSLTLRDPANNIIDFWAHGAALYGAPAGVNFNPAPLNAIDTVNQDTTSYQRIAVSGADPVFNASDWIIAANSRNAPNANQVQFVPPGATSIPTLSEWMLVLLALSLGFVGFRMDKKEV